MNNISKSDLRLMKESDLGSVFEIQNESYFEVASEPFEILKEKLRLAPDFCWVMLCPLSKVSGYILAHPWPKRTKPPELQKSLHQLPKESDAIFIHDCAVSSLSRGKGIASALVATVLHQAKNHGFDVANCVAVQGSFPVWERLGFYRIKEPAFMLDSYGEGSVYLERKI